MANGAFTLQGFESPEEVQARIGKAKQAAFAPQGDLGSLIYQTAAEGQAGMGGALASAMGYEDPAVKQAKEMQSLLKGTDMSSSESLYDTAGKLQEAGLTKQAFNVLSKGHEVRKLEQSEVPDPAKLTRFKGTIDGEQVIGFSDGSGNTYARVNGQLVKNPKGMVEVVTGTSEHDPKLNKKTEGSLDKKIMDTADSVVRLENIGNSFHQESLTYLGAAKSMWLKVKGKAEIDLTSDERAWKRKDAVMRQNTAGALNKYLHDMSGAAISVQEAKRLAKYMPTMEDSPQEFADKLANLQSEVKHSLARYQYWKDTGKIGDKINDKQMTELEKGSNPAISFTYLQEAAKALKDPNMDRDAILADVTKTFKKKGWNTDPLKGLLK